MRYTLAKYMLSRLSTMDLIKIRHYCETLIFKRDKDHQEIIKEIQGVKPKT